ncbi:MAG: zf-TFIIB domain-containing protein [Desulfuromonadales bacterium]|nr:zf-TFIIB domain-containing protein [Desulfuromonadales bacterium]MDT8422380.1 zf-TFIIB domain-containing protein [Desulfuromonadales bacterium]
MNDAWDERKKALENEYFYKHEKELIERLRNEKRNEVIVDCCKNRCPKCGDVIEAMTFRGVPLDKCVSCGGVWLGPKDFQILASKDHRTWFDLWFKAGDENRSED